MEFYPSTSEGWGTPADGKTRTVTTSATDAACKKVKSTAVYDKR